jgi:hypothetical protein
MLDEGDESRVKHARPYERSHKNRARAINAAERQLARA